MKIVIVGGGAIGRLFGAKLGRGGNSVIFVDCNRHVVDALQDKGVGIMEVNENGTRSLHHIAVSAVRDAQTIPSCDLVLLTVKSFATREAASSVQHLVTPDSPIIFMQTGLGNQKILRELFPEKAILAGLTFISGTALGYSDVCQGRCGVTYVGEIGKAGTLTEEVTPRLQKLVEQFNTSGIEMRWSHRIIEKLWEKVIVYATINTLTSILRVPNGMLIKHQESVDLVREMLAEGAMVAEVRGIQALEENLFQLFKEVIHESEENMSSMLQDILNGRATEIEAQSGALTRYAKEFGLRVPRHQTMASLLRLLEAWPQKE